MGSSAARIAENLARVREQIAAAAAAAGRSPGDVRLVAVTKYVAAPLARELVAAGCSELGESRPQELWEKAAALADLPVQWHLVGHLQRNKIRRTLPIASLVHSLDSTRLLAAVEAEAAVLDHPVRGLLEVNVSGEPAKHGFRPDELPDLLPTLSAYPHVAIVGLMTMARLAGGSAAARADFAALRQLRDALAPQCPPGTELTELSMGMSGDFPEAIAEGATIVRIGSALFEGLDA